MFEPLITATHVVLQVCYQSVKLNELNFKLRYQTLSKQSTEEKLAVGVSVLVNVVVQSSNLSESKQRDDILRVEIASFDVRLELTSDVFFQILSGLPCQSINCFLNQLLIE